MSAQILIITDSHVVSDPNKALGSTVLPYHSLKSVVETAAKKCPDPDLVLLLGDFTNDDQEESYRFVASLVTQKFDKKKIVAVEGNHGEYGALKKVFVNEFGLRVADFPSSSSSSAPLCVALDEANTDLVVIPTHTTNKETGEAEIHGCVRDEHLMWLQKRLSSSSTSATTTASSGGETHKKNKNVVIAMHHPPIHPEAFSSEVKKEENSWTDACLVNPSLTTMRDILFGKDSTSNCKLILHGHIHSDYSYRAPKFTSSSSRPEEFSSGFCYLPAERGEGDPLILCTPATCHQHSGYSWGAGNHILKHGCRVVNLKASGEFDTEVLWSEQTCVAK